MEKPSQLTSGFLCQHFFSHVVEKDYVLGWMLAGIYANPELRESWVFKGGTCLKKCFFETYRFSEDLDFTLLDPAHIDEIFLKRVFAEIGQWIYDETGILAPANMQEFYIYSNPRGSLSCQGKVSCRGPVSPQGKTIPRIFVSNLIISMKTHIAHYDWIESKEPVLPLRHTSLATKLSSEKYWETKSIKH